MQKLQGQLQDAGALETIVPRGLFEFTRAHPGFTPLVVCSRSGCATAERAGVAGITWQRFLLEGPAGR